MDQLISAVGGVLAALCFGIGSYFKESALKWWLSPVFYLLGVAIALATLVLLES